MWCGVVFCECDVMQGRTSQEAGTENEMGKARQSMVSVQRVNFSLGHNCLAFSLISKWGIVPVPAKLHRTDNLLFCFCISCRKQKERVKQHLLFDLVGVTNVGIVMITVPVGQSHR